LLGALLRITVRSQCRCLLHLPPRRHISDNGCGKAVDGVAKRAEDVMGLEEEERRRREREGRVASE
jgi:hypothetical protein